MLQAAADHLFSVTLDPMSGLMGLTRENSTKLKQAFLMYSLEPSANKYQELVVPVLDEIKKTIRPMMATSAGVVQFLNEVMQNRVLNDARESLHSTLFEYFHEIYSRQGQWKFYQRHVNECGFDYLRTTYGDEILKLSSEQQVLEFHRNVVSDYNLLDGFLRDSAEDLPKFINEWASMQDF